MILALRTDTFDAYLALCDVAGTIHYELEWPAGRELSVQLPSRIDELLAKIPVSYDDLIGVIAYQGPGSFTGLRIGITVANAIAHAQNIPIVGSTGDDWLQEGIAKLQTAQPNTILTPEYGGEANITKPKK